MLIAMAKVKFCADCNVQAVPIMATSGGMRAGRSTIPRAPVRAGYECPQCHRKTGFADAARLIDQVSVSGHLRTVVHLI